MKTAISDEIVNARFGRFDQGFEHRPVEQQGSDETLAVLPNPDGTWSVQSPTGDDWLSVQMDGTLEARATSDPSQPGPWEKFTRQGNVLTELPKDGVTRPWRQFLIREEAAAQTPAPPRGPLSRLRAERPGFVNREGRRVVIAGVSAFMHYERFLKGENIRPLLEQARELGANCLRVFGMAHYIPVNAGRAPFKPADYGDRYFDAQPEFFALASEYGQYVYWSVFPDVDLVKPGELSPFFDREVATLERAENTFGELTNEQDAHSFNAVDPSTLHRPTVIACCSGSYGDIGEAQPHPWDFCDYHLPRRYEPPTHIKDACVVDHPNYLAGKGILLGEPDRYGTGGNLNHDQARQSAGACRESALGMVFHTMQGRESLTYDDATMAQGRVFFKALIGAAG